MGASTIEARLRGRLLAVVAPVLVGVGVASVGVTAYVLDASDRRTAVTRAESAIRTLRVEEGEGDPLETALREVFADAESDGARVAVRGGVIGKWRDGTRPVAPSLLSLAPGDCGTGSDAQHQPWRACAVRDGELEAIGAVPIGAHRTLVATLAQSIAAVVLLALLGMGWVVRRAVRGPLLSLGALVHWSERIVDDDRTLPPPPKADTKEAERLVASFEGLVKRLFDALARERANSAHIAHELRTPLTSILAELEALPAPMHTPAIERVRADVGKLARVIEAILVLSAPRPAPGAADASAPEGVINLADLARELAPAGTIVEAPDEALVEGDARLVSLALQNLLDNAQKYSGHAAKRVKVSRVGASARISVVDDGPGVDDGARAKMFDRYWRAPSVAGGSGLGLALVRAVAQRHGGDAEATKNGDGPGLEVAMTLGRVVGWYEDGAARAGR